MPALQNPDALPSGEPGVVRPETTAVEVDLASAYQWTVIHTGYDEDGNEDLNVLLLGVNEGSALAGPGSNCAVIPPGGVFTFPEGTFRLKFRCLAGAPLITLLSSKGVR